VANKKTNKKKDNPVEQSKSSSRKLFGTDGVRGTANEPPMTPEMALRLGRAVAFVARHGKSRKVRVVIGKDTRLSGYMFETAIASGICDVSGDSGLLNSLISRLAPRGEIVLAGFYSAPLSFDFAPAFMREASLRTAAQWQEADLVAVRGLVESGALSLAGLITHHAAANDAAGAYRTAFADPECLKMVIDWRHAA